MKKTTNIMGAIVALGLIATLGGASTVSALSLNLRGDAGARIGSEQDEKREGKEIRGDKENRKFGTDGATRIDAMKARATQEIDRRIALLNKDIARINAMQKLSAAQKTSLVTTAQLNINNLTTLKAKIAADTDIEVLKTDVKSITQSYRIFALVHPQGRIIAAADRILATSENLVTVQGKLQVRITAAQTAGKDVTAMNTAIAEIAAKSADAKVQAQNAINLVASLTPDQGNDTISQSNKAALVNAQTAIKAARVDLEIASKDAHTINKALKALNF
jgi:uncharacterized small protein (DUF1192 family)